MQTDWGGGYEKLNCFFFAKWASFIKFHVLMPINKMVLLSVSTVTLLKSVLLCSPVPLNYWDQAFLTAVYLINRMSTKVLNFSTPIETLLHKQPALHTFGYACYWPKLHPYNHKKFEFHSKQCVFLGYSNMHKGFKCLDISSGCICISRDVSFSMKLCFLFPLFIPLLALGFVLNKFLFPLHILGVYLRLPCA